MIHISERVMRGEFISRSECFEHADELDRVFAAYGPAMEAMEKARSLPPCARCSGENGYADAGHCETCAAGPFCAHCMDRHEGPDGECAE